jgi:hypothetical protein
MSRLMNFACCAVATALGTVQLAYAEDGPSSLSGDVAARGESRSAPTDLGDQAIGGTIGVAGGGRVTPGGLRVIGHYLYQMTDSDWFDGTAAFTFGSGEPACFRDRMDAYLCDHGLVDGFSTEVGANVRRFLGSVRANAPSDFWPYLRLGVGLAIIRFSDDDVTGFAIPVHAGGGLRFSVSEGIAVTAEATFDIGIGRFTQGLGVEPLIGGSVTAGAEFRL